MRIRDELRHVESHIDLVLPPAWQHKRATVSNATNYASSGGRESDVGLLSCKLGSFMPHLPLKALLDREDATLPEASSTSFWLHGSAWELPTFENADVFVDRLIRQGILVRDPVVEAAIQGHTPDMSIRSLQYRFLQATGLTHKTIKQIEHARSAVSLLEKVHPFQTRPSSWAISIRHI